MNETETQSSFIEGFLIWFFIIGVFIISITMAIFTLARVQEITGWKQGYSMIYSAFIGIFLTIIAALFMERRSR